DNRVEEAEVSFRRVLAIDAADVGAHVNLAQLLMQQRRFDAAVAELGLALQAEPYNATAVYNLGLALTRSGKAEEGQAMMERFRALREGGTGIVIGQTYPDQGRYAEAIASTGSEPELVDKLTPSARFLDTELAPPAGAGPSRVTLFDYDGDGALDAYAVGSWGQRLYRN